MKKLVFLALTLGIVAVFAMPAVALRAPDSLSLSVPGQAAVTFDHAAHVAAAKNCKECHHMGVGNGQCDDCHGQTSVASSLADAYTNCKTCHVTTETPAAVASCSDIVDKGECRDSSDCRWNWRKGICRDRR